MTPFLTYLTRLAEVDAGGKVTADLNAAPSATHEIAGPGQHSTRPDFGTFGCRSTSRRCVVEIRQLAGLPRTIEEAAKAA